MIDAHQMAAAGQHETTSAVTCQGAYTELRVHDDKGAALSSRRTALGINKVTKPNSAAQTHQPRIFGVVGQLV